MTRGGPRGNHPAITRVGTAVLPKKTYLLRYNPRKKRGFRGAHEKSIYRKKLSIQCEQRADVVRFLRAKISERNRRKMDVGQLSFSISFCKEP